MIAPSESERQSTAREGDRKGMLQGLALTILLSVERGEEGGRANG